MEKCFENLMLPQFNFAFFMRIPIKIVRIPATIATFPMEWVIEYTHLLSKWVYTHSIGNVAKTSIVSTFLSLLQLHIFNSIYLYSKALDTILLLMLETISFQFAKRSNNWNLFHKIRIFTETNFQKIPFNRNNNVSNFKSYKICTIIINTAVCTSIESFGRGLWCGKASRFSLVERIRPCTVTRFSTIVEFLRIWTTISNNKNSVNCIL